MSERLTIGLLSVVLVSSASIAQAHITMISPAPRTEAQKDGPCGAIGSVRGDDISVYEPGATVTVRWDETIDHPSHYRIAFDVDGDDDFVAPDGRDDLYNSPTVLVDAIGDAVGGSYSYDVTLPDVECETCTLQLIQVMYDGGNYFQCADIALRRGGVAPEPDGGPGPGYDGGGYPDAGGPGPGGYDAGGEPDPGDAGAPVAPDPGPDAGGPAPDPAATGGGPPPHRAFVHGGCAAAPAPDSSGFSWAALLAAGLLARRRRRR